MSEVQGQPSWSTWFSGVWIRIPRAGRPVSAGAGDAVAGAVAAPSRRGTVAAAAAAVAVVVADPATPSATTWDACCSRTSCWWFDTGPVPGT